MHYNSHYRYLNTYGPKLGYTVSVHVTVCNKQVEGRNAIKVYSTIIF